MKLRFTLMLLGILCAGAARPARAAEDKFDLVRTKIVMAESLPADAYILPMEDEELTFIPPHDARMLIDRTNGTVRFSFHDERCFITLRHGDVNPAFALPELWDQLRGIVEERYPGAEISAGAECLNSSGTRGCCFTIREKTAYRQFRVITQLGFIPAKGGMIEISLTVNADKFSSQQFVFHNFLNCLRLERIIAPKTGLASN